MPATVLWNPAPLKAAVQSSFRDAAIATARAIEATKPEHRITVNGPIFTGNRAIIRAGGLAAVFEKGAKSHPIFPKGVATFREGRSKGQRVFRFRAVRGGTSKALKMADGRVFHHVIHPGMAARPFLRPQANLFPARFNIAARTRLALNVFRRAA